jgi:hypothetical protein
MSRPIKLYRSWLLLLALSLSIIRTQAVVPPNLLPGGVLSPPPAEASPVGGSVLFNTGPVPFTAGTFSGTLTSTAISGDSSNPWGGLTFTYEIDNFSASGDEIARMTVSSFGLFVTDASYNSTTPVGGLAPMSITRSANGAVLGFNFLVPSLAPGSSSALLVVQTDSPGFVHTGASLIDGSSTTVSSLAPVPEPSTLCLAGLGLLGLLGYRWQRGRRAG